MARHGIHNTKMLLIKPAFSGQYLAIGRCMGSRLARQNHDENMTGKVSAAADMRQLQPSEDDRRGSWWMPHPRTGIYLPIGQELVMDDVPNDAASFDCTFWLRSNNIDEV